MKKILILLLIITLSSCTDWIKINNWYNESSTMQLRCNSSNEVILTTFFNDKMKSITTSKSELNKAINATLISLQDGIYYRRDIALVEYVECCTVRLVEDWEAHFYIKDKYDPNKMICFRIKMKELNKIHKRLNY